MVKFEKNQGFSILEIAVICLVAGAILAAGLSMAISFRQKSRDATRVTDIKAIQGALEMYKRDNGFYPAEMGAGQALVSPDGKKVYLKKVPTNPKPRKENNCPDSDYRYTNTKPQQYSIYFCLAGKSGNVGPGPVSATPQSVKNECVGYCSGRQCGDDGCGNSCGACQTPKTCVNYQCVVTVPIVD